MPENIKPELFETAFEDHPCSSLFLELAFQERDRGNGALIPKSLQTQLTVELGLDEGQTAALAYLAKNRANEITEEVEWHTEMGLPWGAQ